MRLASHILAVFVAISTLVSPCLASLKTSNDTDKYGQSSTLVTLLPDQHAESAKITKKVKEVCYGPCARLFTTRNIQLQKNNFDPEPSGIVPVDPVNQKNLIFTLPAIARLTSQTQWNTVNIYQLCRQLN